MAREGVSRCETQLSEVIGARERAQVRRRSPSPFLEIKNSHRTWEAGLTADTALFSGWITLHESPVGQLMVKTCLFGERIIAKEQRGHVSVRFSFSFLKTGVWRQMRLDFAMRQPGPRPEQPGQGPWSRVGGEAAAPRLLGC